MHYARNGDYKIAYNIYGNGEPLLLVHGFGMTNEDWIDYGYVDELRDDYSVIVMDIRGHGESSAPHDPREYSDKKRVEDIIKVLDDIGIEKVNYWGYSMGGWLGFALAAYYPERINCLITGGATPYRDYRISLGKDPLLDVLSRGTDAWVDWWRSAGFSGNRIERAEQQDLDALMALKKWEEWWDGYDNIIGDIKIPCLLYFGDTEGHIADTAADAASVMRKGSYFEIPDADHYDAWNEIDFVIPRVKDFLSKNC